MYTAKYLSPMVPSFNVAATGQFFQELFEFEMVMDTQKYAIVKKDNLTIHILNAGQDIGEMEFYLEVDKIDSVWDGIKDRLTGLKHKAPFDREYGMREIHLEVPFTKTLMFIGQEIC
jgi:hypothetical protein